uniref:PIH1 domain-containing protein 2 n=1 Tax=Anser cygnoides TaxID=8845 RepID=A0A8B9EA54_ANSCY
GRNSSRGLLRTTELLHPEMAEGEPPACLSLLRSLCGAPAEPRFCLRAQPRGAAPLFVNVCGCGAVPAPGGPGAPVPVRAGHSEGFTTGTHLNPAGIIDIAYNPDVLRRGEENPEKMKHLIHMTLKFVEERCDVILSPSYTVEPFKLKGSLERMQQRLQGWQMCATFPLPEREHTAGKVNSISDHSNAPILLKKGSVTQSKVPLIEEISSTEVPEELSTPVYEMSTVKDANKKPLQIELKVELPKVSSVSECDLRISKDDIIIDVPEKYKLQLDLPELVDEETATATFNKEKGVLFITVSVAKPAC